MNTIIQQFIQRCNELPSVITFKCLIKRECLPEGIMPRWLTRCVNWTMEE